jgi:predicted O-linked N-acetylglucosamine transferase (SPINDLY family)
MTTADFSNFIAKASSSELGIMELLSAAEVVRDTYGNDQVAQLYRVWLEHNAESPVCYAIYFNYGITLTAINDIDGAIAAYNKSLELNPTFFSSQINLGSLYERQGKLDKAATEWLTVVNKLGSVNGSNISHKANALKQIGRVFESSQQNSSAEDTLRNYIDIAPAQRDVVQHWVSNRQLQCKWPLLEPVHSLTVKDVKGMISPLSLSIYADDPLLELSAAYRYSKDDVGIPAPCFTAGQWVPPLVKGKEKLKIGYISSDLRGHAVGYLTSEIYELHDRNKVEVFVYFCGPRIPDAVFYRVQKTSDHWLDVNNLGDREFAKKIIEDGIDILIDLNGHTKDSRTKTLALKPAPIIINWLGYPGTMGSPYHQYILADNFIIPPEYEYFYTEKVLRLPCYQPNDRQREVSPLRPTRAEMGLPEDAMVFCCFNGMQKISPQNFDRWLTILKQVPNGVLWLLGGAKEIQDRLLQVAENNGVPSGRIVFAPRMLTADHLARYPLADLFLDTNPYGAHTTASDALWMGVPILTLVGRGFASRVCGSLALSAGLGELVCTKVDQYVSLAIEIGNNPDRLAFFKNKLAEALPTCTLFDTPKLVRSLEDLYHQIWRDYENGFVHYPDLTNLDVYHDIGTSLNHDQTEFLVFEGYESMYLRELSYRDSFSALPDDSRLWQKR